jgi:hypothetical protein
VILKTKNMFQKKKKLLMLVALFMFAKWWKFTIKKKPLVTLKELDKVYDDIKD